MRTEYNIPDIPIRVCSKHPAFEIIHKPDGGGKIPLVNITPCLGRYLH
jgi:hypothetical protein